MRNARLALIVLLLAAVWPNAATSAGPDLAAPAAETQAWEVVQRGETLADLSYRVYGTHRLWRELFEANRDQLQNPDFMNEGARLRVPRSPEIEVKVAKIKAEFRPAAKQAKAQMAASPEAPEADVQVTASEPVQSQPPQRTPAAPELHPYLQMEAPWLAR